MTRRTHIFTSICVVSILFKFYKLPLHSLFGLIGATIADIDYMLAIKHRTITHSLLFFMLSTELVMLFNFHIGIVYGIGFTIHLWLDSMTKMGVPLFYPWSKRYYGMKVIKTRSAEDIFIGLAMLTLTFMMI